MTFTALLADDPAPAPKGPAADNPLGLFGNPLLLFGLMALFFMVVVLPQNRKAKKQQQLLLTNLKPGAKVVLASGIVGTVVRVHDPEGELTLRSDDAKIRVLKSAVTTVRGDEAAPADAKA